MSNSKCCTSLWTFCFILASLAAINWGLIGVFEFNLVEILLGKWQVIERIFYILVGLSGIYLLVHMSMDGMHCESKK